MWVKKRHYVTFYLLTPFFRMYYRFKYNYSWKKHKEKGPYLILCNHTCTCDPMLLACSFNGPIYYMASNDLLSKGFISKVINFLVKPIPKSKSMRDTEAIKGCLKVAKDGGTICLFPEGNRTYSGELCNIDKAVVKLCKKLNYEVLFYNIEGGYQTDPRFANKIRKGKMYGFVKKILSKEEVASMSNDELYNEIIDNLTVNHYSDVVYKGNEKALYLERAIYYCDKCNTYETMVSDGNRFFCTNCNAIYTFDDYCNLEYLDSKIKVSDLYNAQTANMCSLSLADVGNLVFSDDVKFFQVIKYEGRNLLFEGEMKLTNNALIFGEYTYTFDSMISMTVLGKNKVNFYIDNNIFQIKGSARFSGLKYLQTYNHYKNLKRGNVDDTVEFLGL